MDQAAAGIDRAAEMAREKVPGELGTKVANTMEKTAGYLREHDSGELWEDVEQYVRQHPMQATMTAAFAGFLVARILR
jgi:hypothetical protein